MSQDQRRDERFALRQKIWCEGQDQSAAAETRDVSSSGMFLVSEHAPEVGSQLKVTLKDETGEISVNMEVMWRGAKTEDNKTGVGVRIVSFDKGRDAYERFVKRQAGTSNAPKREPGGGGDAGAPPEKQTG